MASPGPAAHRRGPVAPPSIRFRRGVRRGSRQARGQWPFLVVLAVLAGAVVFLTLSPTHWRRGSGIVAAALIVAGLLRLVLRSPRAGLLVVRSRWFDVACYWCLGVAILILAIQLE